MILDDLRYAQQYTNLHPLFSKAFDFLKGTDFQKLELGKHTIDGDKLFVIYMEYDTKDLNDCIMESHRKYIDIQVMIEGEELMGVTALNGQIATTPYDDQRDAAFYEKKYDALFKVRQNHFTIFYPHDLHMPSMKVESVRKIKKAVFKVAI
jgi:YhcH/YjgK/YiaL family protein